MKQYIFMGLLAVSMCSISSHAEAGNLTNVRVSNHDGTSRIVLDLSEMPASWTSSYNDANRVLTLQLGNTGNSLTSSISQNTTKTGVLKGVGLQPVNGALQVSLTANGDVQHHVFSLSNPARIVVDLFSGYAQQTTKDVNGSVSYSKISNIVPEGKIQAVALRASSDSPMVVAHVPGGKSLDSINQSYTAAVGAKILGKSFERPYAVADNGAVDLGRMSSRGTLRYTPNRGYFIEEKKPSLLAKTPSQILTITAVNTPRKENSLNLYTSDYGPSTKTNDFGYEVTVENGRVVSGQKRDSTLRTHQFVLSGHGAATEVLRKLKIGTPISIEQRPELAHVSTAGGASIGLGTMVLQNGTYIGSSESPNVGRSFIGTTKDNHVVILTVDKSGLTSVGVTQKEGAHMLLKMGATDAVELTNQGSVDIKVSDKYVHKGTTTPSNYEDIIIIK